MLALKEELREATHGEELFVDLPHDFRCENGDALADVHVRLRVYGDVRQPVVVVAGGISSGRCCMNGGAIRWVGAPQLT